MKILVVGGGGREHALVWKISQSPLASKIFCAPGNAGTAKLAQNIDISAEDIPALLDFALKEKIDLTVVGPEAPLVAGIVDEFERVGLKIFGPSKNSAMLEGSKDFSKKLMRSVGIPTASFKVFSNIEEAMEEASGKDKAVVKANGLAAGKGVFVCRSKQEMVSAINKIMKEKVFGKAGEKIVIEEVLEGEEASILAFCDGETAKLMASSQDHKQVFDGDRGPNTGGMGAYSPAPIISKELEKNILETIFNPVIEEMKKNNAPYVGVLYAGLMISGSEPKVLEFNVRFGDPEAQVVLPRLKTDLVEIMLSCMEQKLKGQQIEWDDNACTCVVLASGGYPAKYEKGKEILGLEKSFKLKDTIVFHAGTKAGDKKIFTNGGRVLGVTALGKTIKESIDKAYSAVNLISFDGMHYRKDIGKKALKK